MFQITKRKTMKKFRSNDCSTIKTTLTLGEKKNCLEAKFSTNKDVVSVETRTINHGSTAMLLLLLFITLLIFTTLLILLLLITLLVLATFLILLLVVALLIFTTLLVLLLFIVCTLLVLATFLVLLLLIVRTTLRLLLLFIISSLL
jgi:hypothetical protein